MEYCTYVFKKGKTKGTTCPRKVYKDGKCKTHQPKAYKTDAEKCNEFRRVPDRNPFTNRRIKINGPTYNELVRRCSDRLLKGRWRVLKQIASGGCGSVYLGQEANRGTPCAIKVEHKDSHTLVREITILKLLANEPNVVDLWDHGVLDELRFIVTPLLRRQDVIKDYSSLVLAIKQVARHKLSHGDIKAVNTMTNDKGDLILIDLGLSINISSRPRTSKANITGTPVFMSLNSHKGLVTYRNDLESVVFMYLVDRSPKGTWMYERDLDKLYTTKRAIIEGLYAGDKEYLKMFNIKRGDKYQQFIKEVYSRHDNYDYDSLARILA